MTQRRDEIELKIIKSELSDWYCYLFGIKSGITLRPLKGDEPNWFWRLMQYLVFGNRWVQDGQNQN